MELNLKNPLVFFDLETTGLNITRDRIVEVSMLKVYPNGKKKKPKHVGLIPKCPYLPSLPLFMESRTRM